MNLLRKRTKYSDGIKIWCYSKKRNENENIGWHHTNEDVKYHRNSLYRLSNYKRQYYFTLEFEYTFQYDEDEVYFANCLPFTYTSMIKELNEFTRYENVKYPYYHRRSLCQTIAGNDVDYFIINNSQTKNYNSQTSQKSGIVLFARQHPSETVGSWVLKGAIDLLMGESEEAKYLRDNFIIKIIPMINIDGVIAGNTRTSLAGCDLNRRWSHPNEFLHPEIYYAKKMIMDFSEKQNIECIVDFHGHFGAFNSFFYGNRIEENFTSCRYFPFACSQKSNIIEFKKSKFCMPKYKKGTGRINLFQELNIENVITLETSYFGCITGEYVNKYFTINTLKEIGRDVCLGILQSHYHKNLQLGININFSSYPELQKQVEKDDKQINIAFNNYVELAKKKHEDKELKTDEDNETKRKHDEDEDNNNSDNSVSDSESSPSRDNLDESKIKSLIPVHNKIRLRNKKKHKFLQIANIHKRETSNKLPPPRNLNIIPLPKLESKKSKVNLNTISRPNNPNLVININCNVINKFSNSVDSETQTEMIFFKMHWTYFVGAYKILSAKIEKTNIKLANEILYSQQLKNKFIFNTIKNANCNGSNINVNMNINNIKNGLRLNLGDTINSQINSLNGQKGSSSEFNIGYSNKYQHSQQRMKQNSNSNVNLLFNPFGNYKSNPGKDVKVFNENRDYYENNNNIINNLNTNINNYINTNNDTNYYSNGNNKVLNIKDNILSKRINSGSHSFITAKSINSLNRSKLNNLNKSNGISHHKLLPFKGYE